MTCDCVTVCIDRLFSLVKKQKCIYVRALTGELLSRNILCKLSPLRKIIILSSIRSMRGRGAEKQNSEQRATRPRRRVLAESNPTCVYCDVGVAIYSISVRNRLPQVNQSNCVNKKKKKIIINKQHPRTYIRTYVCMYACMFMYIIWVEVPTVKVDLCPF